ncbi:hypothetical protein Metvu_0581 [Methanocaldococcus vulcanius M7]|uniref:Insertion element IS150 protein InsJ-like helix-turn-helix domain-containing protein n=1 Tax=Methanocaldococcus vulcanius (strain ATCC 700851 / DSM 12094 / M7) TaxID=579137 RepID=C9RFT8_METVM|nr:helix-turn-helix domain-containing protein [Methanocaldococcus vulcanius]ACX72440.1 hypothetical protein Metvu_0581 [Methanocaldococcus vulcanius M7]
MVSQEELLNLIINNGGAVSTREIREVYNIDAGNGLGHISQRLRQLMKKKIISKVKGLNGEVIYFLIDLRYLEKENKRNKRKYSLSNKELKLIEKMFEEGMTLKDIAEKVGISYRWCKELYRRYRIYGQVLLKKDGRPLKGRT